MHKINKPNTYTLFLHYFGATVCVFSDVRRSFNDEYGSCSILASNVSFPPNGVPANSRPKLINPTLTKPMPCFTSTSVNRSRPTLRFFVFQPRLVISNSGGKFDYTVLTQ